jgi:hypothetical protein
MKAHLFCAVIVFSGAFVLADATRSQPGGDKHEKNAHTTIERDGVTYTLPFELPTAEEITRALHKEGDVVDLRNRNVQCELLSMRIHEARHYDIVGPARRHSVTFKCTISSDGGRESIYMDREHLILE